MNEKLTPDRIEAARETLRTTEDHVIQTYSSDQGLEVYLTPELNGAIDTAIIALDLAERFRWRSIAELREEMKNIDPLKQLEDKTPVLAQSVAWGKCVITTKGRLIDVPYEYSAWMPLPEWEG